MSIKHSRSCMVHADTCCYAHFPTGPFRLFSNSLKDIPFIIHTNSSIICFFSGGKSCPRSRRISNRIGSRKCCSKTRNGKCSKQQWFYSNTAFLLRKIHFRTIHLIYSHSITNKIEYIFCLLSISQTKQKQ